jgi:hypothetical protein
MRYEYLTPNDLFNPSHYNKLCSLNTGVFMYSREGKVTRLRHLHSAELTDNILYLQFNEIVSARKPNRDFDTRVGIRNMRVNLVEGIFDIVTAADRVVSDLIPVSLFVATKESSDDWSLYHLLTEHGDIDPDPNADTAANFQQDKSLWISEMYPGEVIVMQQVTVKDTVTLQEVTWYRLVRGDDDPVLMEKVLGTFRKTFPSSMVVTKAEVVSHAIAETTMYTQSYPEGT